eukprot:Blabericola_migrator_1__8855@NODE_4683_length_1023_cov_7_797071_g2912_i0_p1_GENE_NODE_4683_length_1023_cov_7_797071_g2912_i0NODE_4683_length_1023_cov_7_797071_g2912_i0_p1_ORF_typecomplete_len168_score14_06Chromo/PF00385_24/1_8e06_NODE_4683_length_1023_cov_7_797071_g2912_i0189692
MAIFFGLALMVERKIVQQSRSIFIRVFGDIIYSIDTLRDEAFDGLVRSRIRKARVYLDVLEEVVSEISSAPVRPPKLVPFTIDVEPLTDTSPCTVDTRDSEIFEMEEIRGIQLAEDGSERYLVKWCESTELTWEPVSTIDEADAHDLVQSYKKTWNLLNPKDCWIDI